MTVIMSRLCNGGFFIILKYKHSLTKNERFYRIAKSSISIDYSGCGVFLHHIDWLYYDSNKCNEK